jgi:hypothetical protein
MTQLADVVEATAIRPFQVSTPEAELTELQRRINATRFPEKEPVADLSQGVPLATMQKLARYWATEYDWRKVEAKLKALPQFITEIDGLDIHFIHVRSKHELTELRRRINATRFPEKEPVANFSQGVPLATMQKLARYWTTEYDWRKVEAKLIAIRNSSRISSRRVAVNPTSSDTPHFAEATPTALVESQAVLFGTVRNGHGKYAVEFDVFAEAGWRPAFTPR